jgi:predicted peroxiredoxin
MKLGILVNTNRHLEHIVGLAKAAVSNGHEVIIFNMDEGAKLLGSPVFEGLCKIRGISMSFCDYNAKGYGVPTKDIPEEIVCAGQYNNAVMMRDADRVIVL